jgi:hypothetical protein
MSLEKEAAEGMNVFCCESLGVTPERQIYHSHLARKGIYSFIPSSSNPHRDFTLQPSSSSSIKHNTKHTIVRQQYHLTDSEIIE